MSNIVRLTPRPSDATAVPDEAHWSPVGEPSPTVDVAFVAGDPAVGPALPPAEADDRRERRGPMRPERLSPTRRRLHGQVFAWAFQAGDGLFLLALTLGMLAGAPAPIQAGVFVAPALAVMAALSLSGLYRYGTQQGLAYHLARTSLAMALGAGTGVALLSLALPAEQVVAVLGPWLLGAFLGLYILHGVWWALVRRWRRAGRLTPNVVVVGATPAAEQLIAAALASRDLNVLGVFDDRLGRAPSSVRGVPVLGDTRALVDHRIMPFVDRIIVAVPPGARERVRQVIEALRPLPNEITLLLEDDLVSPSGAETRRAKAARDVPLARIAGPPSHLGRAIAKRALDLTVGAAALVVALPIMAIIALAIRADSPGPIFFRQRRQGFNNEEIVVWKFRSMRHDAADAQARRQVQAGDDRVTRVGRFIRATSLDELPQILNVLKGEMSLVGPRPHAIGMMTGDVESARLVAEYAHRHRMKPGMTGWAAIHGSRGPVDTPEDVRRRVELDVEYIERQSLWLDLYIIAMTIPCLLGDRQAVR